MAEVQAARAAQQARQSAVATRVADARAAGADDGDLSALAHRMSLETMASGVSVGRADSILESFPFVPPSPISNLPPRTPPRSPLAQQSFANAQEEQHMQSATQMVNRARASASSSSTLSSLVPPNRKALGMSVASQSSTVSNGLGSFPFQIDSGAGPAAASPPTAFPGRQRASLDTLALTADLSSYPLGFDRSAPHPPVPGARR